MIEEMWDNYGIAFGPCHVWSWRGLPNSKRPDMTETWEDLVFWEEVDNTIDSHPIGVCITSPSEYIREYKKYRMDI